MMTRKQYVLLADALARADRRAMQVDPVARVGVNLAVEEVAKVLAADNPAFNFTRFLDACRKGVDV